MSKEFTFTKGDFERIKGIIHSTAGINLGDHKFEMVYGRLARRLRATNLEFVEQYLDLIEEDPQEQVEFVNVLTTNLTYFFRENHHFEFIAKTFIPEIERKHSSSQRVRIWSAGCSTGEEPYSLAYTLEPLMRRHPSWDIKILATDLDTNVLAKAKRGVYPTTHAEKIPRSTVSSMFDIDGDTMSIKSEHRDHLYFKKLNLIANWPTKGPFNLIICRNVLIYFDRATQQKIISRFRQLLPIGAYLILGHSESIGEQAKYFEPIGRTIFRRQA